MTEAIATVGGVLDRSGAEGLSQLKVDLFWEQLAASEYGFWANVNPEVPHPRWSQADEQVLGSGERVPTQLFNGYGEFVAALYTGLENEELYI